MRIVMHEKHNLKLILIGQFKNTRLLVERISVIILWLMIRSALFCKTSVLWRKQDFAFPQARIPYVIWGCNNEKYSVCKLSRGRENWTCLIMKRALDILLLMEHNWSVQLKDSSIRIPRNLQESARVNLFPLMDKLYWSSFWNFCVCLISCIGF